MEKNKVKRGEIYLYDFGQNPGSIQNGKRPVFVVQCEEANQASTTTVVAAITTAVKKRYLPSHIFLNDNYGLREPSMVMMEQLKTVDQEDLNQYIGRVDSEYVMKHIDVGLKKAMGLWVDRPPKNKQDVRCLCSKCLSDYMNSGDYIIKRLDPFAKVKGKCDKCGAAGWDYTLLAKKSLHGKKSKRNE